MQSSFPLLAAMCESQTVLPQKLQSYSRKYLVRSESQDAVTHNRRKIIFLHVVDVALAARVTTVCPHPALNFNRHAPPLVPRQIIEAPLTCGMEPVLRYPRKPQFFQVFGQEDARFV